jgi:hypothetical protein
MKKILPIIIAALLLGWIYSNKSFSNYHEVLKEEKMEIDTGYIEAGYYSSNGLSYNEIIKMDVLEKTSLYLSLTDSLPDLWKTRDVDETSNAIEDSIPSLPDDQVIYLLYRQKINGYSVKVDFVRSYDDLDFGRAILSFSKPGSEFKVYCDAFSDEKLSSAILEKTKVGETVNIDYVRPKKKEYLSSKSPFYFKDMDFDGEEELVVNNLNMGSRGYNNYDVFKVLEVDNPLRLIGLPFTDGLYKITDYNVEYEPKSQCILDKRYDGFTALGHFRYKSIPSSREVGLKRVFVLVDAEDMGFYHPKDKKASDSINLIQPYKKYERVNGKLVLTERGVYESGNYGWNQNEVVLERLSRDK